MIDLSRNEYDIYRRFGIAQKIEEVLLEADRDYKEENNKMIIAFSVMDNFVFSLFLPFDGIRFSALERSFTEGNENILQLLTSEPQKHPSSEYVYNTLKGYDKAELVLSTIKDAELRKEVVKAYHEGNKAEFCGYIRECDQFHTIEAYLRLISPTLQTYQSFNSEKDDDQKEAIEDACGDTAKFIDKLANLYGDDTHFIKEVLLPNGASYNLDFESMPLEDCVQACLKAGNYHEKAIFLYSLYREFSEDEEKTIDKIIKHRDKDYDQYLTPFYGSILCALGIEPASTIDEMHYRLAEHFKTTTSTTTNIQQIKSEKPSTFTIEDTRPNLFGSGDEDKKYIRGLKSEYKERQWLEKFINWLADSKQIANDDDTKLLLATRMTGRDMTGNDLFDGEEPRKIEWIGRANNLFYMVKTMFENNNKVTPTQLFFSCKNDTKGLLAGKNHSQCSKDAEKEFKDMIDEK